jgi:DNA polymerase III subunit gamma/tau
VTASPSLYRRHRPRTFDDVVGQEHVVRTLRNAIERDRVHHAYLFVGSRGTGKTSMAKILAASLNCQGEAGGGRGAGGPTLTPCGECMSCRSIADATSLDVIEMDAASNNSVDDIRDLREKVAFAPVSGRHKVYILDEAHMLSTAAWNAFLKTLEEPPPNTIFVLATTEAGKVLPTVVDRCHRFDFGRPTVAQITAVLRRVAGAEGIEVPDEACALIARAATGSFRDALGTLEQLVAYAGGTIALEDVLAVLGAADADLLLGAVDAVAAGDARAALLAAARLAESGRDVERFFADLEAHARALLVTRTLGDVPVELSVSPEHDERLAEQAHRVPGADVVRLLDLIAAALRAMKDGADARTQLELALVKAAEPALEPSTKALLARVERLEAHAGGAPPAARPAGRAPEMAATAAGRASAPTSAAPPPAPNAETPPAPSADTPPAPNVDASPAPNAAPPPAADAAPDEAPSATVAVAAQVEGGPTVTAVAAAGPEQEGGRTPAAVAVAVAEPGAAPQVADLDLHAFADLWPAVLDSLREESGMLAAALQAARPARLGEGELTLAWPETAGLHRRKAEDAANREAIARAIRAVTGTSLRLAHEIRSDAAEMPAAAPVLSEDEVIERFQKEFDAEILSDDEAESRES